MTKESVKILYRHVLLILIYKYVMTIEKLSINLVAKTICQSDIESHITTIIILARKALMKVVHNYWL